jgi:cystathionine beta-lyase/cystathionine gamma-synthase
MRMTKGFSTTLIHGGEGKAASLTTPVYQTSTFVFESAAEIERYNAGDSSAFLYSRYGNPTVVAAEEKLAVADGAEASLLFGSGMAAASTLLLGLLQAGDEVVCSAAVYGGTVQLLSEFLPRFGLTSRFVSTDDLREPSRVVGDRTRVLWFESPTNPTLRCVDIANVVSVCRERDVVSVLDNTFASPVNQRPLEMGVDVSVQSATKYLNGHSDVTAGVLSSRRELIRVVEMARRTLGGVLDPQSAFALMRGLKTLPVRMARHNASALAVASALEGHPHVLRVHYPGLTSHSDHALATRQMSGFGGIVTVDLVGGQPAASLTFDALRIVKRAVSLGGVESLCSLPVLTSHAGRTETQLAAAGVSRGMLRFSIGLEDPEDVLADIVQAISGPVSVPADAGAGSGA